MARRSNKGRIIVGCCGFAGRQAEYFQKYDAIELQQTFYKPPQPSTAERWREQAPEDFTFTMKAWQVITHPASSPTYRKAKIELDDAAKSRVGFFRPTDEVLDAWHKTREIADIVQAKFVVFQCPASFKPTDENVENLREFFRAIGPQPFDMGWEPRGQWPEDVVRELCEELGLVHVVDPFSAQPLAGDVTYFRLHGIGGYRYRYTDEDLRRLLDMCPGGRTVYVMFNNVYMGEDALRFMELLGR